MATRVRDASRLESLLKVWVPLMSAIFVVGPFVAAGTLRWAAMWTYLGAVALGALFTRIRVQRSHPELIARRRRIGAGTKRWDLVWFFFAGLFSATIPVAAGFGVRLGWSAMPWALWGPGVALQASGSAIWASAMVKNPHFESTVRIQTDRGHRVVDTGPYGIVRHPGYAGFCLSILASPFLLRSWAAMVAALCLLCWLMVRTAIEDATLRAELPRYVDYARRVRFRLIPGIW